jgi:hypothetical protein
MFGFFSSKESKLMGRNRDAALAKKCSKTREHSEDTEEVA